MTTALSLCLAGSPAHAQSRPVLKQSFLCAQSWDASTYQGHGPDPDSLDFGYWRGAGLVGDLALHLH